MGGGGSISSYTYTAAIIFGLCEGPISDIPTVWISKTKYTGSNYGALTSNGLNMGAINGQVGQAPWSYLTSKHPTQAIGYSGLTLVYSPSMSLDSSGSVPTITFEAIGNGRLAGQTDADAAYIINDLLTNPIWSGIWPTAYIGDLTTFQNYTRAAGLNLSPVLGEQKQAADWLKDLAMATNSEYVMQPTGTLTVIPYADTSVSGNGYSYSPPIPLYDLTPDDLLTPDNTTEPVTCTRKAPADCYNVVKVEFLDRTNDYNVAIAEASDLADIDANGQRVMSTVQLHMICDVTVAKAIAQLILQRSLYVRNQYQFTVGQNFGILQPMDLVTITDPLMGLLQKVVRILEVDDGGDDGSASVAPGTLTITAEEYPAGSASHALYQTSGGLGYIPDYGVDPGNVNTPLVISPPYAMQESSPQLEAWIVASGSDPNWGGCNVYVSLDNASFAMIGTVNGRARQGVLTSTLASHADPDTVDTLSVDLTESLGQLLSGTKSDADNAVTICYVDGEMVSYETATLTATNKYDLTYLRRGLYASTIGSHASGSAFARLDDVIFKYPYAPSLVGQTIYFKFQSFNIYGGGFQDISTLTSYPFLAGGTALPANVTGLTSKYVGAQTYLSWDPVQDARPIIYQVRMGSVFGTSIVVGSTSGTTFLAPSNGTFWVVATVPGMQSATPAELVITGSTITQNILADYDEAGTGWSGTLGGAAALDGTGHVWLDLTSGPSGTYEIPAGHVIDVGTAQNCQVSVTYEAAITNPGVDFDSVADVDALTDFDTLSTTGIDYHGAGSVQIQVALSQDGTTWGAWQPFAPGIYHAQAFKLRASLASTDANLTPVLQSFSFAVDVPGATQVFTGQSVAAAGTALTFSPPYHLVPEIQVTVVDASSGDYVNITGISESGCTVQVLTGGSGVARTCNILTQGY